MNYLTSFFVGGTTAETEFDEMLKQTFNCSFYNLVKKVETKVFPNAQISFTKAEGDNQYSYLVKIEDNSEDSSKSYQFPIQEDRMKVRQIYEKNTLRIYLDEVAQGVGLICEFPDQGDKQVQAGINFKETLCKLLFQRTFKKSWKEAEMKDSYMSFCNEQEVYEDENNFQDQQQEKKQKVENQDEYKQEEVNDDLNEDQIKVKELMQKSQMNIKCLFAESGELYEQDKNGDKKTMGKHFVLSLVINSDQKKQFASKFQIQDADANVVYSKEINSDLNYHIKVDEAFFEWVVTVNEKILVYGIQFDDNTVGGSFQFFIAKCILENSRQCDLKDVFKGEDEEYQKDMLNMDYNDDDLDLIEEEEFGDEGIGGLDNNFSQVFQQEENQNDFTGLCQAKKLNLTFASNMDVISVFKTNQDHEIQKVMDLNALKDQNGNEINPMKMMMQQEDTKMLFLDEKSDTKTFQYDIEYQKILAEFELVEQGIVEDISHEYYNADMQQNLPFMAISEKNMYKIDPREKDYLVDAKAYKQNNQFTRIMPNKDGNFAIANMKGEVRLYDRFGIKAKNLYAGFGDPIFNIDVSKDGKWILGTCEHYLLVIPTFAKGIDGFKKRLGADKPLPRRLTIKPIDLVRMGKSTLSFKNAKFDGKKDKKQKYIVTSVGEYLITWNLRDVFKGKVFKYSMKKMSANIVDSHFKFDNDDYVFLATQKELVMEKTKKSKYQK